MMEPASAVTWSMTQTGRVPHRTFPAKACVKCGAKYQPTGGKQRYCSACTPAGTITARLCKRKKAAIYDSAAMDAAPLDMSDMPGWCRGGDWSEVDKAWVAVLVEAYESRQYSVRDVAAALVCIRQRYRATVRAVSSRAEESDAQAAPLEGQAKACD